jgi:effector-binding domain-containing protein
MFNIPVTFEKKITIAKSITELNAILSDFSIWNKWSPWLCLEPEAKTEMKNLPHQVGHFQSWDGELIGAGNMTLSKIAENHLEIDLNFLKPFKSKNKVWFDLKKINDQTEVTWGMQNNLPFFMFFLKKMILAFIGNDFERGLLRLKEFCENGTVMSELSNVDKVQQVTIHYIGLKNKCTIDEMKALMQKSYAQITSDIMSKNLPIPDGFINMYQEFDLVKGKCDFISAIYYYQKPENVKNYENGILNQHTALKLVHKGPYHHLGTAWKKVYTNQMGHKIKLNKNIPMYEIYLNSPEMVAPKDIQTEVRLAIQK